MVFCNAVYQSSIFKNYVNANFHKHWRFKKFRPSKKRSSKFKKFFSEFFLKLFKLETCLKTSLFKFCNIFFVPLFNNIWAIQGSVKKIVLIRNYAKNETSVLVPKFISFMGIFNSTSEPFSLTKYRENQCKKNWWESWRKWLTDNVVT